MQEALKRRALATFDLICDRRSAAVTDMKDGNRFTFDGEEYPIFMHSISVEQLADLKGKGFIFRSEPASMRLL